VLIIAVLSGGGSNTDTTGGGSNTDTTDSPVTTTDNSSSAPSGADYTAKITTNEIISTFSSKLRLRINQDDPFRGITFPEVSTEVDVWSAPFITILIYPDSNSLKSDDANFQQDFTNLNNGRAWESCSNVIVIFPNSMQDKIDSAVSTWCTGSTDTPTPTPTSGTHSSSYRDGFSSIYGWQRLFHHFLVLDISHY
jgi:hypothetical protein